MSATVAGLLAVVETERGPLVLPDVEYRLIGPILVMIGAPLVLLTLTSLVRRKPGHTFYALFSVAAGLLSMAASAVIWDDVAERGPRAAVAGAVAADGYAAFFYVTIATSVVLGALVARPYLEREGLEGPEFYVLAMLSASGGMVMAAANDLVVLFLGLEVLSIALYVMTGFHPRREQSREAAMKYFVLGAFSSALFLYGVALTYGATGSTQLPEIAGFLATNVLRSNGVLLAGMALLFVGLGFKVAAVPFHTWTPDVYQGAPSPATAFMAGASKAAGFAGLLRLFFSAFSTLRLDWQPIVWVVAVLTLLVGSVLAIVQQDIKRMLAYSSINHAGYVLVGLQAANPRGLSGALVYLLAYTFMVVGSFAVVTVVGRRGDDAHALDAYRGLYRRRPGLALAFTAFLLAQAGVPLTTGFLAKFTVIAAAVEARSYALAVLAMLAAAVAAFFYLRVIVLMFMADEAAVGSATATGGGVALAEATSTRVEVPTAVAIALAIAVAFTLGLGVFPDPLVDFADQAVARLL